MRSDKFQCLLNEKVHTRGNSLVCVAKSVRMEFDSREGGRAFSKSRHAAPAAARPAAVPLALPFLSLPSDRDPACCHLPMGVTSSVADKLPAGFPENEKLIGWENVRSELWLHPSPRAMLNVFLDFENNPPH
jgi:hypothetical protein